MALGLIGGLGVAVLVFGFRLAPSEPPVNVMLIILAVVTASATLQIAGGLDYLVQLTERVLRRYPKGVTILAPLSTFVLTVCVGTGHSVYALVRRLDGGGVHAVAIRVLNAGHRRADGGHAILDHPASTRPVRLWRRHGSASPTRLFGGRR